MGIVGGARQDLGMPIPEVECCDDTQVCRLRSGSYRWWRLATCPELVKFQVFQDGLWDFQDDLMAGLDDLGSEVHREAPYRCRVGFDRNNIFEHIFLESLE